MMLSCIFGDGWSHGDLSQSWMEISFTLGAAVRGFQSLWKWNIPYLGVWAVPGKREL